MKFRYSPEVDILMVDISDESYRYGEDNEGVIVHHGKDGNPLGLEILDGKLFVMFANTSLATEEEVTNPVSRKFPSPRNVMSPFAPFPRATPISDSNTTQRTTL